MSARLREDSDSDENDVLSSICVASRMLEKDLTRTAVAHMLELNEVNRGDAEDDADIEAAFGESQLKASVLQRVQSEARLRRLTEMDTRDKNPDGRLCKLNDTHSLCVFLCMYSGRGFIRTHSRSIHAI